ncbi:Pelargonidin 3-o-(6-caffeoylglucoside) 5-o-(6-o-malonylglucoside) 4'''-malonyltransferase [Heracleum sosnowskyi]|uniref:Pelargonidin 3-o-(6-caffeoylglucoside) 5-o-(6-o-malonylglucoside) 4'''-malonyltransferase n=1 Tax=Heracleum sosnowskyi TaxID=360622 RepID=A0AAD8I4D4_9APIA|nr:Pelargonidin 3-o-(6-caffeoylglucoside) 5-o-(6-o-malonylglucoside) 4'''-malonyltransferase [Heracleum sosnowskyi]
MKVDILSRELITPYTSTPPSLRDYRISLVDELSPTMNTPTILYYPFDIHTSSEENGNSNSRCNHLKKSLSKVLTRFYPLAGRYLKDACMVDCSDQGAEFVEAKVDIRLDDLISQGKDLKVELLNFLLPCPIGAVDEVTDPLLAVQVSTFACGGYAIALMTSHRIADMSTASTFISEWGIDSKLLSEGINEDRFSISSSWNSGLLFPGKTFSALHLGLSRSKENIKDHKIITKNFFFDKSAISRIREKAKVDSSSEKLPTRVQSVVAIIGKAIIDLHVANPVNPREFLITQALNMRERTNPPLPKNQCGNLYLPASAQSVASERGVEFRSLVDLLSNSVKRGIEKCKILLSTGDEGQMMIANCFHDLKNTVSKPGNFCGGSFSDLSKFSFYEADFGWGKPIWVSMANVPVSHGCFLLADKSGEGMEAWIGMNVNDMSKFENDRNIMEFTTRGKLKIDEFSSRSHIRY